MRFAFADPPYLGCGKRYSGDHEDALDCDRLSWHLRLIERLGEEYPDGWVLCLHTVSLRQLLPLTPDDCRIGAWVKPFASFKPNVNPAYAWEPVIFRGGRKRDRSEPTVRDWHSENITLKKGLVGAKPEGFCRWVIALLGARPGIDTMDDLFPGTGALGRVWEMESQSLFAEPAE